MIGEEKVRKRMARMEVGDCIESDHHPLVVLLERKEGRARGKRRGNKEELGKRIRGGEKIREAVDWESRGDKGMDEELKMKTEMIGKKLREGERERRKKVGWWNEECEDKKRSEENIKGVKK